MEMFVAVQQNPFTTRNTSKLMIVFNNDNYEFRKLELFQYNAHHFTASNLEPPNLATTHLEGVITWIKCHSGTSLSPQDLLIILHVPSN